MILYDFLESGNGYKVRLLLSHLDRDYEWQSVNVVTAETREVEFIAKNPNGRIPALELADGTVLAESNAILFYLADGTDYLPENRLKRAQALQWMFFEQYSHEPYIAVSRHLLQVAKPSTERDSRLARLKPRGHEALAVMEGHLAAQPYFVGASYSVADIALFAYTHVAHEGGFDLSGYPSINSWMDRVQDQPGHIPITLQP